MQTYKKLIYKELQEKPDDALPLLFARLEDFVRRKKNLPSNRILPLAYDNAQEQFWFCNFFKKQQDHLRPLQLSTLMNLKTYVEQRVVIFYQELQNAALLIKLKK